MADTCTCSVDLTVETQTIDITATSTSVELRPTSSMVELQTTSTTFEVTQDVSTVELAAGGITRVSSGGGVERFRLTLSAKGSVPANGGVKFLGSDGITTLSTPMTYPENVRLRTMRVDLDAVPVNTYAMDVLVNGSVVTAAFLTGQSSTLVLNYDLTAGDAVSYRLRRTSGTGESAFRHIRATLDHTIL